MTSLFPTWLALWSLPTSTSDSHPSYVILLRSFGCKCYNCFFFLQRTLSSLAFLFCPRWFFVISLDFNLHQSVLSHQLRSSFYSSFPPYSFSLYDDVSLWLGQALVGLCALPSFYINHRTSCTSPLTLTYSITSRIYQGLSPLISNLS